MDISIVADSETKTYTQTAGKSDNYFNSQTDTTYTLQFKTSGGSAGTQSGNVTGNIQLVMDLGCNVITDENRNGVRLALSGTNDFSGGLVIKNGTLHGHDGASLGASTGTITFDQGVLMSGLSVNDVSVYMNVGQNIQIADNSWGGLRASRQITVDGKISGNGDLVIVTENAYPVILTNADNNYTGVTSVGTVPGGSNTKATLTLGADNVLPATTILEVGKSQNATYNYESASSEVRLNGTTNTVAGLYGVGIVNGEGTLNINVADGEEYTFSGKFSGNQKYINISGSGKQIFAGTNEMQINTLTVTDSQLGIDRSVNNIVNVGTLTLTNGTIDLQGYLTVSGYTATGTSKITNTSDTTAIFHRTGLKVDTTLDTSMLDGNIRLVLEGWEGARALLGTSQSFTGGITVTNMAVRPAYVDDPGNFLGVVPTEYKADAIILDGGTIQNSGNSLVIHATQGITVTEKGGSIRMGNSGDLTTNIYSIITGKGWFGVTGDMAFPVILHGANTYQGETRIGTTMNSSGSAGGGAILSMGAENVLPSTSDIVFGRVGTTGSNLRLYGFNQSVGALISRENGLDTNIAGAVADMGLISSNDSVTLTIGNANSAGTYTDGNFTGAIQNTGETANSISLVKVGSGKQILGGTLENTRTDLTVQGGTVELAKSSDKYAVRNLTLEAGQVTLTGNGGNQIGGYVAMYEETVFDLNGKSEAVTYLSGAGTIQNSATAQSVLTVSDGGGQNYKGIITGNIRLVKDGGGRQYLEGTNNYSGGTLIKNGILYTGGGSLGTGAIEFEGGTLMAGGSSKYEQDIVLANGKIGNFRAGGGNNGTVMTFTGVISGAGTLRFNES
ncbi:MAG: autotransporter-associated beta strand repeat-containing protein, partial [Planctomycetia bacterium]|nr:autotransporter-associated beta strand repeat-containing protein [Planctomycetia bacterium]